MGKEALLQKLQVDSLLESMFPSEIPVDTSYFTKDLWSLREFCILINNMRPEDFVDICSQNTLTEVQIERISNARNIYKSLLRHSNEICLHEKIKKKSDDFFMSPWKFIKWCAKKGIPLPQDLLYILPISFLEIYFEYIPDNSPLKTHSKYSREYHEALYLKNARQIRQSLPNASYQEIYEHPHMQKTLQYIRTFGGKYKKRTVINSWLPKLEKRKRGRPRKNTYPTC